MAKQDLPSIVVEAKPSYVNEQSDPVRQKFVWSYDISIRNESDEIVQLLHRYWQITDSNGHVENINGLGVVGRQPIIKPGDEFIYTSFAQLSTPQGVMAGHYDFQTLDETVFEVTVPKFALVAPVSISKNFRSQLH